MNLFSLQKRLAKHPDFFNAGFPLKTPCCPLASKEGKETLPGEGMLLKDNLLN